jgi:hypothetical protein
MAELKDIPILAELGDQLKAGFRRREVRRLPAGRLVAAATAGAAIVIGIAWGIGGGLRSTQASAAQALRAVADAAQRQPDSFPKPNQFFYIRWLQAGLVPVRVHADELMPRIDQSLPKALVRIETWEWWSTTRTGEIRSRVLSVTFPTAAARALWQKLGRPPLGGIAPPTGIAAEPIVVPLDPHTLTLDQVLALPTIPRALYGRLFAGGTAHNAVEDVRQLDVYPIGPRLRAALYRALALVPGIRDAGRVRTLTGQVGEAIGAGGEELIIDPRTGTMLGSRSVVTESDSRAVNLPAGTISGQVAIVQRAITNSLAAPRTQR